MIRLQNVLKMSSRRICKTSWRRFEGVLKTSWQDVLKMSWRRLQDVLKRLEDLMPRRLEDVWTRQIYCSSPRRLEDVLKTSSEDVWLIRIYSSSSRRLEDVFWRRRRKTSSRRLHQDECLLGKNLNQSPSNKWKSTLPFVGLLSINALQLQRDFSFVKLLDIRFAGALFSLFQVFESLKIENIYTVEC